jgi:ribosomal protein S18 acetylase RimI-like enzyme
MITIRNAKITDVEALLLLLEQLGYPTAKEELEKRFARFLASEGYGVAVACNIDQIVGFVAWSKSKLFVSDSIRIHIEGLVVDKEYRGKAVGKNLMLFAEEYARSCGPAIIDLTSGLRRAEDGSHQFYDKLGYKNEGLMAKLYLRKEV